MRKPLPVLESGAILILSIGLPLAKFWADCYRFLRVQAVAEQVDHVIQTGNLRLYEAQGN